MKYQSRQRIAQDLIEAVYHFSDSGVVRYDGFTFSVKPVNSRDFPEDTNYRLEIREGRRRVFVYHTAWSLQDRRIIDRQQSNWRERAHTLIDLYREGFQQLDTGPVFEQELQHAVEGAWEVLSYGHIPSAEHEGKGIALRYEKRGLDDIVYCAVDGIEELAITARGSAQDKNRLKIFYRSELVVDSRRLSPDQEPLHHSRGGKYFLDPLDAVVDFVSLGSRSLRMPDDPLDLSDIAGDDTEGLP